MVANGNAERSANFDIGSGGSGDAIYLPGLGDTTPIINLADPRTAPQELLDGVVLSEDYLQLQAATNLGPLALEVYYVAPGTSEMTRAPFISPASAEQTFDIET